MTRDERIGKLVSEWQEKGEKDYRTSLYLLKGGESFFENAGFHAQQACEKFLKALLTAHQIEFPKTHDLERLLQLLRPVEPNFVSSLGDLDWLTTFGVEQRYPGPLPAPTETEILQAVEIMKNIRERVTNIISA